MEDDQPHLVLVAQDDISAEDVEEIETKLLVQVMVLVGFPLFFWLIPGVRNYCPMVIIQIIWGVIMGPSVFGFLMPTSFGWLFSSDARLALQGTSFFGILIFVFFTGLHIEKESFIGNNANKQFWVISFTSLGVPIVLGSLLGLVFYYTIPGVVGEAGSVVTFCFTIGLTSGITALPVLSAILLEVGQLKTPLGTFMLLCATFHDLVLWILVVILLSLSGHDGYAGKWQPVVTAGLTGIFLAIMLFGFAPLAGRLVQTRFWQTLTATPVLIFVIFGMCISALITDLIEIHSLLGAVIYGALLPHSIKHFIAEHIELLNVSLLLPLFFGSAGLKVQLQDASMYTFILFIGFVVVVLLGQLLGTAFVARFIFKHTWPTALILFSYMSSKGVVELVIATILLERRVISTDTFSALILRAITCTAMTKPLVLVIQRYWKLDATAYDFKTVAEQAAEIEAHKEAPPIPEQVDYAVGLAQHRDYKPLQDDTLVFLDESEEVHAAIAAIGNQEPVSPDLSRSLASQTPVGI